MNYSVIDNEDSL
jgi:hypothetical protein